jgi:hypothetical protein
MKKHTILLLVLLSVFITSTFFWGIKYIFVKKQNIEFITQHGNLDSLCLESEKKIQALDSAMLVYKKEYNNITKKDGYIMIKDLYPIIIESRIKPSTYKIFFIAKFDEQYSLKLELGSALDSNTFVLSGLYRTISPQQSVFELKKSEIKRPITGRIFINTITGCGRIYPLGEDSL